MITKAVWKSLAGIGVLAAFLASAAQAVPVPEYIGSRHLQMVLDAWGTQKGEPRYNKRADFTRNGRVDNADLEFVRSMWGQLYVAS